MFFGQILEVFRGVGFQKISTFPIKEGVFGKLENRVSMIPGRNIKHMRFRWWKAQIPFAFIIYCTSTSCVK